MCGIIIMLICKWFDNHVNDNAGDKSDKVTNSFRYIGHAMPLLMQNRNSHELVDSLPGNFCLCSFAL